MAYEDDEQLEALKDWWQRNGRVVIVAAVVGVAAVLGWQQWGSWQARQAADAAAEYQAVLSALNNADREVAVNRIERLQSDHDQSPYTVLASLAVASAEMADGKPAQAAERLAWITRTQPDSPMAVTARLRHAEALVAAGDQSAALSVLDPPASGPLAARYQELIGDLEAARGNREAAIAAYRAALQRSAGERRALVEVKLFDLGAAAEEASS